MTNTAATEAWRLSRSPRRADLARVLERRRSTGSSLEELSNIELPGFQPTGLLGSCLRYRGDQQRAQRRGKRKGAQGRLLDRLRPDRRRAEGGLVLLVGCHVGCHARTRRVQEAPDSDSNRRHHDFQRAETGRLSSRKPHPHGVLRGRRVAAVPTDSGRSGRVWTPRAAGVRNPRAARPAAHGWPVGPSRSYPFPVKTRSQSLPPGAARAATAPSRARICSVSGSPAELEYANRQQI
jgi:hypothetical protein